MRDAAMRAAQSLTQSAEWEKGLTLPMFAGNEYYDGAVPVYVDRKTFTGPVSRLVWCSRSKVNGAMVTSLNGAMVAFHDGRDPVSVYRAKKTFDQIGLREYVNHKAGLLSGQAATWRRERAEGVRRPRRAEQVGWPLLSVPKWRSTPRLEHPTEKPELVHVVSANRVVKTFGDLDEARKDSQSRKNGSGTRADRIEAQIRGKPFPGLWRGCAPAVRKSSPSGKAGGDERSRTTAECRKRSTMEQLHSATQSVVASSAETGKGAAHKEAGNRNGGAATLFGFATVRLANSKPCRHDS